MDITDEQNRSKAALTSSSQCVSSIPSDHAIPQMVITSADDITEDQRNVSECTLVLVPPESGISTDRNDFQNGSSNIQSGRPDVDFEDISVVVKDVISKCTDTVSHSISQRPLVIEVIKGAQHQQQDDSSSKCPPPPPPLPPPPPSSTPSPVPPVAPVVIAPPSASQRPLVFDSAVAKTEPAPTVGPERISPVTEAAKIHDELNFDLPLHEIEEPVPGVLPESSSPTKKESLHGVKKFFDSLWHTETQDAAPESGDLATPKEMDVLPDTPKSDSSNIKKIFRSKSQSPKVESPVDKNEPVLSSEPLSEKESSSFAKDAKQSIKSFFDSFKHEPNDQIDSIKVTEMQLESIPQSSPPQTPKEGKESTSFVKDTKQNIKTFFDSFKHESDGTQVKCQDMQIDISKNAGEKIPQSLTPESPKEGKESTSFVKDTKQNIKTFFDNFKHESDGTQTKSKDIQLDIIKDAGEKITQSSSPGSPKEGKESTSFVKDTKQNIKTFFDSFKHESDGTQTKGKDFQLDITKDANEKTPQSSPPESPIEGKESTSFVKDTKQNIKTFFDSFKHESDGSQTKGKDLQLDITKDDSEKIRLSSPPGSPKDEKEQTSFVKDTKQNIKTFFDSFKHESSDQKKNVATCKKSASQPDFGQEPKGFVVPLHESSVPPKDKEIKDNKESKSLIKDTRQNIKSFFETFKHDSNEQKQKVSEGKICQSEPDFSSESEGIQLTLTELPEIPKEKEKCKETKDSASFTKDTKQNIKSFFDTFKHEASSQKLKETTCKKSASQPDFSQDAKTSEFPLQGLSDISKVKEAPVAKDTTKQNRKSIFDSFKYDSGASKSKDIAKKPLDSDLPVTTVVIQDIEITKPTEDTREPSSFAKDARQNIKTFFDTFKHDSGEKHKDVSQKKTALSEPDLSKDSVEGTKLQTKDAKHPLKKFFSFKHGEDIEAVATESTTGVELSSDKEGKNKSGKVAKSVKLDLNIQYSLNGAENGKKFGSYSHMNGHEDEIMTEVKERAQSVPSEVPRKSTGFGILSRERKISEGTSPTASTPDISAEQQKDGRHGIKKFFDSFKHEKSDADKTDLKSEKDRSQSVLETEESKSVEKPIKDKKGKSIKRSLSDKVSREEVVQNFKGFFDSLSHKTPSKKSLKDDHIYDTVEVRPEFSGSVPVIQVSEESNTPSTKKESQGMKKLFNSFHSKESLSKSVSATSQSGHEKIGESMRATSQEIIQPVTPTTTKKESQGMKKIFSPFHSKESSSKSVDSGPSDHEKGDTSFGESVKYVSEAQKSVDLSQSTVPRSAAEKSDISGKTDESAKADKTSMFNSFGENILALKDKMLHGKEKRKSELVDDSVRIELATSKVEPLLMESSVKVPADVPPQEELNKDKHDVKTKPVPPEKPKQKEMSKVQTSEEVNKLKLSKRGANETPGTLYDTCCMKIAILLRDKALDIVSERTKSPPPKPPKPSAEAIARARAAVVSRRLDAQRRGVSVGEGVPVGCDGMRFVDDETESSCDYKDVENFDYIMDYELINRYKLDSSKLDTFSVPSTCSGLTSFYTADNVTLRDEIFSDAGLETVSLSSDVSYSFKQLSSTSKSEPKLVSSSSNKDLKKGVTDIVSTSKESTVLKQTTIKKVPPPIPPKPDISKLRTKSDVSKVSQCVNGLSLSPRLQNKFAKDSVATQKRPLMVADIKETQFSSLQHPKPKVGPKKPARSFDTVLKHELLKTVSGVTDPSKAPLSKYDSQSITPEDGTKTLTKPEEYSTTKIEKRTKSPPRPPPPVITKKPTPQRPPPPVKRPKEDASHPSIEEKAKKLEEECDDLEKELSEVKSLADKTESIVIQKMSVTEKIVENEQTPKVLDVPLVPEESKADEVPPASDLSKEKLPESEPVDSSKFDLDKHTDELNNNLEINKKIADSLNNNIGVGDEKPKPPPRNRRIRSRTVEVTPTERCEERLKRSQSLSEIDIQKRVTFLNAEKSEVDSKSLYTVINKEGKRLNSEKTAQSSPDLVSSRPLPAPPPPPRRFRSLERKSKSKSIDEKKDGSELQAAHSISPSDDFIKPPRRRKTDKERFLSLHTDHRRETTEVIKRASSVPSKPDRQIKSEQFDENANISSFRGNSSNPNIPEFDSTDSISRNKLGSKSPPNLPERKSSSSWYDASDTLDESWEVVDISHSPEGVVEEELKQNPKVPVRHKSGSKQKSRVTSKFYVNMEEESITPADSPVVPALVDKETSPLPLDCSEKSVQTSLETLSQGIASSRDVSHDVSHDESEDTDELLDLAQTLQKELSTIINRHKSVRDSSEETSSPPLSAAASEKNLAEDLKERQKISSVRSSTSEVWPLTSSDESDIEAAGETSPNLNEVAVKRKEKKIFYIAREIMTSEEVFVDALKLLNVDFKMAVESASKQRNVSIIPDDALSQILNHLPQLQHLNENLLMELKDRIENWDKTGKIADIIVKMGPFLKLYSWYIHDFESNVALLEDCKKKYPIFAQVIKEFEMSPRCKRLALNHYMLKPIQRIPQYRLLLQEYLHHLTEDSKDYQDTVTALQIVSEVANHANESMKHGDNAQKLISIQNSILGHKEIVKPGRVFVKEGELMKLSRKGMQPRWFVLFNDLLLYLTSVQQGLYRVNHDLPLVGMKVAIPIQQDYQNEFSIISVTRSFTLAAKSQDERQEWIIALTKAIEENASKRKTFASTWHSQSAQDKTSSEEDGAFVLGKKAPVWIPDARVTMCQLCTSEFTVTFRRHHCRACGKVICSICSSHRISLPYLGNRIARVCDECHTHLGQGSSACTESGETDSENQQIAVKSHLRTDKHMKNKRRALPSVLKEVCANDQGSTISGYLHKRTGKSWKRDWFVVKDKVLYEYKASEDVAALRSVPLLGYEIELFTEPYESIDSSLLFQLTHPGQAPIIFYADTVGSTERWVSALKTATVLE